MMSKNYITRSIHWIKAILIIILLEAGQFAPFSIPIASAAPTITPVQIDDFLRSKGSPMAGNGLLFVKQGLVYNVDPRLVVAISGAETSFGKTGCGVPPLFNAWGYFPHAPHACSANHFPSYEVLIPLVRRNLRYYLNAGLNSLDKITGKWTTGNPNTVSSSYLNNVRTFYTSMGGNLNDFTFPSAQPGAPSIVTPKPGDSVSVPIQLSLKPGYSVRDRVVYNYEIASDSQCSQMLFNYNQVNKHWLEGDLQATMNYAVTNVGNSGIYYLRVQQGDGAEASAWSACTKISVNATGGTSGGGSGAGSENTSNGPVTANDGPVSVTVDKARIGVGEKLSITLGLDGTKLQGVWAYQALCNYNSAVVSTPTISLGSLFNSQIAIRQTPDQQFVVAISQTNSDSPVTKAGTVATIALNAQAKGQDTIQCNIQVLSRDRATLFQSQALKVEHVIADAGIVNSGSGSSAEAGTITGKIKPAQNLNGTIISIDVYNASTLDLVTSQPVTAGQTDVFTISDLPVGNYIVVASAPSFVSKRANLTVEAGKTITLQDAVLVPGDLNGDALVDIKDLSELGLGFNSPAAQGNASDINGDGFIDLRDLVLLANSLNSTTPLSNGDKLAPAEDWNNAHQG